MNVLLLATKWRAPAKRLAPLILRYRRWTFRMREGKQGKRPKPGDPQSFHEVKACLCLFLYAHVPEPYQDLQSPVSLSPRLRLSCSPAAYWLWWVGVILYFAGSVWHLQGSRRENEVRSGRSRRLLGDDGRCFNWAPIFIQKAASIPQGFLGNNGTECTRWMKMSRLTIFWVSSHSRFSCATSDPIPSVVEIRIR